MEDAQLSRAMEVDLGAGLGDDLGGFEGFDDLFAYHNTTPDFFKFCALDEAQQETGATVTAPPSPGSSALSLSPFGEGGGHPLPHNSWNYGQQNQIGGNISSAQQTAILEPTLRMHVRGKPRARKRLEEGEPLEAAEMSVYPVLKRRSSAASAMKTEDLPAATGLRHAMSSGKLSDRTHLSLDVPAAADWSTMVASEGEASGIEMGHKYGEASGIMQQEQQVAAPPGPPGGAIKVNKDLTSNRTRPRISVFMSSGPRRGSKTPSSPLGMPLEGSSPRMAGRQSSLVPTAAQPANYLLSPKMEASMDRTASAQSLRLKGLRVAVRARSQAELYVVEHNPAVVAMGSRHTSMSALESQYAPPTLHRATSVGALTIAGNGEVHSTSPVLSSSGRIIQSCELSEQLGGGGQRRNLVCKVFGTGSPFSRPSSGPGR